jgi:hypothetical protein
MGKRGYNGKGSKFGLEKKPPTAITNKIVHRQLLQSLFNMQLPT